MSMSLGKFILSILHSIMFAVPKIDQAIIGFKTIRINGRYFTYMLFYNWIKLLAHTINCFHNHTAGNPILQFEQVLS